MSNLIEEMCDFNFHYPCSDRHKRNKGNCKGSPICSKAWYSENFSPEFLAKENMSEGERSARNFLYTSLIDNIAQKAENKGKGRYTKNRR